MSVLERPFAAVDRIRRALIEEADAQPSEQFTYGRPHDSARYRSFPRYTRTGQSLPGRSTLAPDCPSPVKGRCECRPDGSWRMAPGARYADDQAYTAELVEVEGQPLWTNWLFGMLSDGLWVTTRPHRVALERLRKQSMRRFLVLNRLLDGDTVAEAWYGLGDPVDPIGAAEGICRDVEALARAEALAEYDSPPSIWPKPRKPGWTEQSESQQNAVIAGETGAA